MSYVFLSDLYGFVVLFGRSFSTSSRFSAPFHLKAAEPNDCKEWQNDPRTILSTTFQGARWAQEPVINGVTTPISRLKQLQLPIHKAIYRVATLLITSRGPPCVAVESLKVHRAP